VCGMDSTSSRQGPVAFPFTMVIDSQKTGEIFDRLSDY
jgi:hypothetical protein